MPRISHVWMLLLSLFAFGCTSSQTPDPVGGETHFLEGCDGDTCGLGLDCVCGVCTKACATDNSCGDLNSKATCEAAGTPNGACGDPLVTPVCDVNCTVDGDCSTLGSSYTCESGSCRKLSVGACIVSGVITAQCMDSGLDGSIDGSLLPPFPTDLACSGDDIDGGVPFEPRLLVRSKPPLCAAANAVLQLPGVELIDNGRDLLDFEITATDVYWYSWPALHFVRAEIGSDRSWTIDENRINVSAFAIDGCDMVAGPRDGTELVSLHIDGSEPRIVATGLPSDSSGPDQILRDSTHIYISHWNNLFRVPLDGGALETLRTRAAGASPGLSMLMRGDRILWIENVEGATVPSGVITSIPKDGVGETTIVASDLPGPTAMATDGTHLYVAVGGTVDSLGNSNNDGALTRMPIDGGTVETLRVTGRAPLQLAVDATQIYWVQLQASNGQAWATSLWKAEKSNPQNAIKIADDAWTFRIDATHIYWSQPCITGNTSEGFLMRVPK